MSLSFPSIWVHGSSFILASCLIDKEAISSVLLDRWLILQVSWSICLTRDQHLPGLRHSPQFAAAKKNKASPGYEVERSHRQAYQVHLVLPPPVTQFAANGLSTH